MALRCVEGRLDRWSLLQRLSDPLDLLLACGEQRVYSAMRKACFCQFILAIDVSHASDDAFETLIAGLIAIRSDTQHADELRKVGKVELVSYIGDDEAPPQIARHLKENCVNQ